MQAIPVSSTLASVVELRNWTIALLILQFVSRQLRKSRTAQLKCQRSLQMSTSLFVAFGAAIGAAGIRAPASSPAGHELLQLPQGTGGVLLVELQF